MSDDKLEPMTRSERKTVEVIPVQRVVERCGRCGHGVLAHIRFCPKCSTERIDG